MSDFTDIYGRLNTAQREAVDTIEGPLLVIAGPGTGKTQLLSARVANILESTDTLPQNILCLTFTESGAENMRQRLTRFIGQTAYDVTISTYHGFGSDIIYRFPQYFTATQLQNPVDTLGKHQIIRDIVAGLSYSNPLKQLQHHLGDLMGTISEVKRALLTADDLRAIAKENSVFITTANKIMNTELSALSAMPRMGKGALPLFEAMQGGIQKALPADLANERYGSLGATLLAELSVAVQEADASGKTTPLTAWKNKWLAKDQNNQYVFDGGLENERIAALADVLEQYQAALAEKGLYDFDDMIARAIEALERHPELKYSLQEQYLYIMLDEFQDTNAAQLRLVQLMTDNPILEQRPNVMAVGDDDQAIYAFQGAQYSNMIDFYQMYRDVKIINLTENYRSHANILETAANISEQIGARLHQHIEGMSKTLTASNSAMPSQATLVRHELASDVAHYTWIAEQIAGLIKNGTAPEEIAVLAPKHKQLEPLVAHLNNHDVAVRYEKRENILETPVVRQLLTMSRLVMALHKNQFELADSLWPEVLSFDFWQIPTRAIWQLSWQVNDQYKDGANWTKLLLDNQACATPALLLTTLAHKVEQDTCETILDYLVGSDSLQTNEADLPSVISPLRSYYTSPEMQASQPDIFYDTISHLRVLREKLRDYQATINNALSLQDLISFIEMYQAADERMLNTSPYNQQVSAVQLMTVFKAKGLEFEHVFLACCHDDVWGGSSRGMTNRLTLPANLKPIRHAGATDDERLRILFVAITRAKYGLYLASFAQTYGGKSTKRLKYLSEQEQADGSIRAMVLPDFAQVVTSSDQAIAPELATLELDWRTRHIKGASNSDLNGLLQERLKNYQMSPTHLNSFTDTEHGGPNNFFFTTILRFPQAPTPAGQYGNAMHETMEWLLHQLQDKQGLPGLPDTIQHFKERLALKKLSPQQQFLMAERGQRALTSYLKQRGKSFKIDDVAEHNFKNEGVFVGEVHLGGKIDRMEIDKKNRTIVVVDYKTGAGYSKWERIAKLHKYRQQLYAYKLLIEGSHTYQGYKVIGGRLEFVEPDQQGNCRVLELTYDDKELERTKQLLQAVWARIHQLDFPDISSYSQDLKGIELFEQELLGGIE